jgi:predicted 2-oxoglutarate/Fe(II)-dependent dioxygenase YbiX
MNNFSIVETMDVEGMPIAIHFANCIDETESFVSALDGNDWKDDLNQDGTKIGSFTFITDKNPEYAKIHESMMKAAEKFLSRTERNISDYNQRFDFYKIVRWESVSRFMGEHADAWEVDGEKIVPDISLVMYLTDDFEGGKVTFSKFDKRIKPTAGDIIAFNSTTMHGVDPYLGGRRMTTQLFLFKK